MTIENELEVSGSDTAPVQGEADYAPVEEAVPQQEFSEVQKSGIQKRIDQMTAKMYEKDAMIAQLTEQMVKLSAAGQERMSAPAQAPTENLYEGMDPGAAAIIQKVVGSLEQKFQARVQAMEGMLAASSAEQVAKAQGLPPAVIQRANALMAGWKERGFPLLPKDAVNFAVGEAIADGTYVPKTRTATGQYAPANPVMTGQTAPAPVVRSKKPLPQNFEQLPSSQQVLELEARGIGDEPL